MRWTVLCFYVLAMSSAGAAADQATGCAPQGKVLSVGGKEPCLVPGPDPGQCPKTPSYDIPGLWACPKGPDPGEPNVCPSGVKCIPCEESTTCGGSHDLSDPRAAIATAACRCPAEGCAATPRFNWALGSCKGSNCADYPKLKSYKDQGSQAVIRYVAAYQFDASKKVWVLDPESSFNTDGAKEPYDLVRPSGGLNEEDAWLAPQPGGVGDWGWGYYPGGVPGVGPPAMLFVLSTEQSWNFVWIMLNQLTLDRGPAIPYPPERCAEPATIASNCWGETGNVGEIDFLQPAFMTSQGKVDGYRRLYASSANDSSRCFLASKGSTCNASGMIGEVTGYTTTNSYMLGSDPSAPKPYVFAAVVDQVGTFIYRLPSGDSDPVYWLDAAGNPGLTRKTAACTLAVKPTQRPGNNGPPCDDSNPYCGLFLPNCQADVWDGEGHRGGYNQGCIASPWEGFCSNWFREFVDTGQWLWPENGRRSLVNFVADAEPEKMPWNYEMESSMSDWNGNVFSLANCCVKNQGHCPGQESNITEQWLGVAQEFYKWTGVDKSRCFGTPKNRAQPTPFVVPFEPVAGVYTFTDTENCPQGTTGGPGCLPGPTGDYANSCRQCTVLQLHESEDLPLCPNAYFQFITLVPNLPNVSG